MNVCLIFVDSDVFLSILVPAYRLPLLILKFIFTFQATRGSISNILLVTKRSTMSTVEHNIGFKVSPPGMEVPIVQRRPLSEGVFYDEERPEDEEPNTVAFTHQRTVDYKPGLVQYEVALMDDGTIYPVLTGAPDHQRSDTAIVFTTAWLTSTRGHNMRTMLRMMQLGYPTVMIGPEGEIANHTLPLNRRVASALKTTIPKTAEHVSDIAHAKLPRMNVREKDKIGIGESRGAMVGFGVQGLVYGDFTAPCFSRAPTVGELPSVATQLGKELTTLGKLGIQLFGPSLRHYPGTLHTNPEYYLKELLKIRMLMSGQAGKLALVSNVETPMHVRTFTGDGWSQAAEWRRLFADRPHVHIETVKGNHLDIANPSTLGGISLRLARLVEVRGYDGLFSDVDYAGAVFSESS